MVVFALDNSILTLVVTINDLETRPGYQVIRISTSLRLTTRLIMKLRKKPSFCSSGERSARVNPFGRYSRRS
jgi:hypothetical protein